MTTSIPATGLSLRSLVTDAGVVELSVHDVAIDEPGDSQVLVQVQAAPINPSDLGLLLAGADAESAVVSGSAERPVVTVPLPEGSLRRLAARVGVSLAVGNEGAGTVVAAGSAPDAQALLGRTVAAAGGSMYSQYRSIDASACLVLPPGTPARVGASSFVNPLTALGMVATMRAEGHTAIVHTAAASNLGQMLVKLCLEDGVPLVNVVRSADQVALLHGLGAEHVCDSSAPGFMEALIDAITATSATIAFDAIGGGRLVSQILTAMEAAASATSTQFSTYGSNTHKQGYIYGGLDPGPTTLTRSFGFAWGLGGWLLTPFLVRLGQPGIDELRARVVAGLTTTFASSYTAEVSLVGALSLDALRAYAKRATGEKHLVTP